MSKAASHQEKIEKFSFIYTLTYSRPVTNKKKLADNRTSVKNTTKVDSLSSSLVMPSILANSFLLSESRGWQQAPLSNLILSPELISDQPENPTLKESERTYLDKILFVIACGYLLFVGWWILSYQLGNLSLFLAQKKLEQPIALEEARLLNYLEEALTIIDRKTEKKQKPTTTNTSITESIPQVVYVPVYTSANTMGNLNDSNPLPIVPPPPPNQFTNQAVVPTIPVANSTPEPLPISPPSIPTIASASTSTKPEVFHYTLVGLLELGEESTALFQVDDITKKIGIGEEIDDTGWKLESITNQKISISRQGEVRSLTIGEEF